jgi:hypothetical protein
MVSVLTSTRKQWNVRLFIDFADCLATKRIFYIWLLPNMVVANWVRKEFSADGTKATESLIKN